MGRLVPVMLALSLAGGSALAQVPSSSSGSKSSEQTAKHYALWPTMGGLGLAFVGGVSLVASPKTAIIMFATGGSLVLVGPSFGHLYAGEHRTMMVQLGMRVAAAGAFAGGIYLGFEGYPKTGLAMGATGAVAFVVTTIYSIADSDDAVRRQRRKKSFALTPVVLGERATLGTGLVGRF